LPKALFLLQVFLKQKHILLTYDHSRILSVHCSRTQTYWPAAAH